MLNQLNQFTTSASTPVLENPCPAHFVYLPNQTHTVYLLQSLLTSWWVVSDVFDKGIQHTKDIQKVQGINRLIYSLIKLNRLEWFLSQQLTVRNFFLGCVQFMMKANNKSISNVPRIWLMGCYSPSSSSKVVWISLFCRTQSKIFWRQFAARLFWGTMDFHSRKKILWKSMVLQNCSVSHILQNIFRCVQQNKDMHTGTIWGRVNDDRIFVFWWTIPLILIYFIQTLNFKRSGETLHLEHKTSVGAIVIQRLVARFSFQFLLDLGSQIFLSLVRLCL